MSKLNSLASLNALYETQPSIFTEEEVDALQDFNVGQGVSFKRNQDAGDFNLFRTLGQIVDGFVEGFTTFDTPLVDDPRNTSEHIARSIGHLAGFLGIIPTTGGTATVGSLIGKTIFKTAGIKTLEGAALKGFQKGAFKAGQFMIQEGKSLPMMVADGIMKAGGKKLAVDLPVKFLEKQGWKAAANLTEGALQAGVHLGIASGVSDWREVIDGNVDAIFSGAALGALSGGAAALWPTKNLPLNASLVDKIKQPFINAKEGDLTGVARILSGSLFQGLPTSLYDQPSELQVYNYLLGAYFGAIDVSPTQRKTMEYMSKAYGDPLKLSAPETINPTEWKTLSPEVQAEAGVQAELMGLKLIRTNQGDIFSETGRALTQSMMELRQEQFAEYQKNLPNMNPKEAMTKFYELTSNFLGNRAANKAQEFMDAELTRRNPEIAEGKATREDVIAGYGEEALLKANGWLREEAKRLSEENLTANGVLALTDTDTIYNQNLKETMPDLYNGLASALEYAKEKQLDTILMNPIKQLTDLKVMKDLTDPVAENRPTDLPNHYSLVMRQIIDTVVEYKDMPDGFTKLETALELKRPTKEEDSPDWRLWRGAFKELGKTVVNQGVYDNDTVKGYNGKDVSGEKDVTQYKDRHYFSETLQAMFPESKFMNIKKRRVEVEDKETGKTTKQDVDFWDYKHPVDIPKFIKDTYNQGYIVFGGAKANADILMYKQLLDETQVDAFAEEINTAIDKAGKTKGFKEEYDRRLQEFAKDATAADLPQIQRIFKNMYYNNIAMYKAINRIESNDVFIKGITDGTFLNNPTKLTKRLGLLHNGFPRATGEYMPKDAKSGLKTVIISTDDNMPDLVKGKADLRHPVIENGFVKWIRSNQIYDGVIYLRDDVYDAMTLDFGWLMNTGAQKGTLLHPGDNGEGLLIGKYAYHRAGSEMSKEMATNGTHTLLYDTAAKQSGTRKKVYMQWDSEAPEGGRMVFIDPNTKEAIKTRETGHETPESGIPEAVSEKYLIPHDAFTGTSAGEHDPKFSVRYASQFISGVDDRMPNTKAFIENMMNTAFYGTPETNQLIDHYTGIDPTVYDDNGRSFIKQGNNKQYLDELDWADVGIQRKLHIINGGKDDAVYRSLLNHYITEAKIADIDGVGDDYENFKDITDTSIGNSANRVLKLATSMKDGVMGISPAVANSIPLKKWFNQVVTFQMLKEINRPRAKDSWITIFNPYRPDLIGKNIDLQPGEALLGEGARTRKINWSLSEKGKITLEKAIEAYSKETDPQRKKVMEEDLEIAIQRSPTDSPSGIRIVKIKGFSGIDGEGIVMHPEDMANAGGADLDIDKGFAYTSLPADVRREFKSIKDEWYNFVAVDETGRVMGPGKPGAANTVKVFKDPKDPNMAKGLVQDLPQTDASRRKNPWAMFDPATMMEVNKDAVAGNNTLGPGINASKIALANWEWMVRQPAETRELEPLPNGIEAMREFKRTLINLAADASDGSIKMINPKDIYSKIMKLGFVNNDALKAHISANIKDGEGSVIGTRTKSHREASVLYDVNAAMGGRKDGKPWGLTDIIRAIKPLASQPIFNDLGSPFFNAGIRMGTLTYGADSEQQVGELAWAGRNAYKQMKMFEDVVSKDPEKLKLIGRNVYYTDKNGEKKPGFGFGRLWNNYRTSDEYQALIKAGEFEKARQTLEEYASQDFADAMSAMQIIEVAPKSKDGKYNWQLIEGVQKLAAEIKDEFMNAKRESGKEEETMGAISTRLDAKNVNNRNFIKKMYGEDFALLYDTYILSSIDPRYENLDNYISNRITSGKTPGQLKKDWFATNWNTFPMGWITVSDRAIKGIMAKYDKIIQRTNQQLTQDEMTALFDMKEEGIVSENKKYKTADQVREETTRSTFIANEKEIATGEIKDPEIKEALDIVTDYFRRHPDQMNRFEGIFIGSSLRKQAGMDYLGGVLPQVASKEQLMSFATDLMTADKKFAKDRKVYRTDYFRKLQQIGTDLTANDPRMISLSEFVKTGPESGEFREAIVLESAVTRLQRVWGATTRDLDGATFKIDDKHRKSGYSQIFDLLDEAEPGFKYQLSDWIQAFRERRQSALSYIHLKKNPEAQVPENYVNPYSERWMKRRSELQKWLDVKTKKNIPFLKKDMTNQEIFKYLVDANTSFSKDIHDEWIYNEAKVNKLFRSNPGVVDEYGYINQEKLASVLTRELLNEGIDNYSYELIKRIQHQQSLEAIQIDPISYFSFLDSTEYTSMADIKENSPSFKEWLQKGSTHKNRRLIAYSKIVQSEKQNPVIGDILDRQIMAQEIGRAKESPLNKDGWMDYKSSELYGMDTRALSYFPHIEHDKTTVKEWVKKRIDKMAAEGATAADIQRETFRLAQIQQDDIDNEARVLHNFNKIYEGKESPSTAQMLNTNPINHHLQSRNKLDPTPGWSTSPDVWNKYERKMASVYHRSIGAFLSNMRMKQFSRGMWNEQSRSYDRPMGEHTDGWVDFMAMFNRNNLGIPSIVPDEYLRNESLSLNKSNPAYWLMDDFWRRQLADRAAKFGFKSLAKQFPNMTPEDYAKLNPAQQKEVQRLVDWNLSEKLNWLSNVDAKWNLISLLTHTKTMINNIVGGSQTTIASAGTENWMKSFDFAHLKKYYFPWAETSADITKFIEDNGGVESFMKHEAGASTFKAGAKFKDLVSDFWGLMKTNKLSDDAIMQRAKLKGMKEDIFEGAAYFMRKSEIEIRKRSWLAHYMQARKHLESNGLRLEDNNPWLITMANRGVETTQFLYNNANRPMFAQTALGKIYSRFQLWSWNSMQFRRDVYRAAKFSGFKPNSPESNRLRRLMTADMFTLALATTFSASLFQSTLAPPFSYLQDLSAFFFGESEEKERAFYGQLPYPMNIIQPLSPPSTRVLFNTINFALTLDTKKFWGEGMIPTGTITTWLPYGRLAQSTMKTIGSPSMVIENFVGLPVHRIDRLWRKNKENKTDSGSYLSNPLIGAE